MNRLSIILADANTMTKIDNLIEELGKLTVVEAGELSKRLEKEWGLNLEAFMGATAQAQEPAKEESVLVDVILTGYPADKKISVLKKVREFIDMGLMEAKNFVEALPKNSLGKILKRNLRETYERKKLDFSKKLRTLLN